MGLIAHPQASQQPPCRASQEGRNDYSHKESTNQRMYHAEGLRLG
jgi:hypothetical protein